MAKPKYRYKLVTSKGGTSAVFQTMTDAWKALKSGCHDLAPSDLYTRCRPVLKFADGYQLQRIY